MANLADADDGSLPVLVLAGNNCAGAHLRPGTGDGDHRPRGDAGGWNFPLLVLHGADVLVDDRLGGDHLAAVDD